MHPNAGKIEKKTTFTDQIPLKEPSNKTPSSSKVPSHIKPPPNKLSDGKFKKAKVVKSEKTAAVVKKTSDATAESLKPAKKALNWRQEFIHLASGKALNWATGDYAFDQVNEQSKKQLLDLTGNSNLATALVALAPTLTAIVLDAIGDKFDEEGKFYKEGIKKTLEDQHALISDCLNATLLKMMSHIALSTKNAKRAEAEDKVTFPDMVSHLLGFAEDHLKYLHREIPRIEKIKDDRERKRKLKELLKPFKNEILHKLLPNGAHDIVLPQGKIMNKVRNHIYEAIEDSLSDIILKNYHAVMDISSSRRESDTEALRKLPGGDVLNGGAEFIAKKLPQQLPEIIQANILPIVKESAPRLFLKEKDPKKLESLSTWLGNAIRQIVTSDDPQIQTLWNFGEYYLSSILKHVFLKMAEKSKDEDGFNVLNAILKYLVSTTTTFFESQNHNLNEALKDLREAVTPGQKALQQAKLIHIFEPLSDEILAFIGLDQPNELPVPAFVSNMIFKEAKKQLPSKLAKLYQELNPPEKIGPENFTAHKLSDFVGTVLGNAVPAILDGVQTKAPPAIVEMINEEVKLDEFAEGFIADSMKSLLNDPEASKIGEYLKGQVEKVLTDILIKMASDVDPTVPKKMLIPIMLQRVAFQLGIDLKGMNAKIKGIYKQSNTQEERKLELRKLFTPLTEGFLNLAGPELLSAIPIPEIFKKTLMDALKEKIIPDLLGEVYVDMTKWGRNVQQEQDKLLRLFKNDNPAYAAKAIAKFTTDILPFVVRDPDNKISEKVFNVFSQFMLKQSGERAESIYKYMRNHSEEVKALFNENFVKLVDPNFGMTKVISPAIEDFIESAVLKCMAHVCLTINEKQKKPDFLLDMGLQMIKIANHHFKEINRIMEKGK